ncbi:MAG: hypothetical protein AAFP17_04055 [Pseudomonadota bacterium]
MNWWAPHPSVAASLLDELKREVGPDHQLASQMSALKVTARREDRDDVLVQSDAGGAYIVHLAWAGREKDPQWPSTRSVDANELREIINEAELCNADTREG